MAAINFEEEERLRSLLQRPEDELGSQPIVAPEQAPEAAQTPANIIAAPPATPDDNIGGSLPAVALPKPDKLAGDQAEVARLQKSGSGIDQIMNPVDKTTGIPTEKKPGIGHRIGSILARIGDVAGSAFLPGVMANIPGTSLHHDMLLGDARRAVTNDLDVQESQAKIAKATDHDTTPKNEFELWHQQNPNGTVEQFERAKGGDKLDMALTKAGLKRDANGNVVADPDSPVTKLAAVKDELLRVQTESVRAGTDLKRAQEELARTKNDPNSPAFQLAVRKLEVAKMNAESMQLRGQAAWANYNMHAFSKDLDGNVLPGAMLDEEGRAIGSTYSANVRPTGQERGKADMANSAKDQIADMKEIVGRRKDIFGPVAGRTTDFNVWLGSQDPDAQRIRAARTIAGDHLAGTFGGRSEAALDALDKALGSFKDNPDAVFAGLDQIGKANDSFIKWGTVKTEGSKDSKGAVRHATVGSKGETAPEGTIITMKDGSKQVKRGGKWVAQ